jgi:hypothetical protein
MQREREGKKWWGLDVFGKVAQQGEIVLQYISAVTEEKESFGEKIELLDDKSGVLPAKVLDNPSERRFNVVIDESLLLKEVKLVARGYLRDLSDIPEQVRVMFLYFPHQEILVFENVAGKRVYALVNHVSAFNDNLIYRRKGDE